MKEKYKNITKKFKQIINEKNSLKEKRSKSFIENNIGYLSNEAENNNNDVCNLTKNSFYIKEDNNMNIILNKKFDVLKKSLDKLQLIIENNINYDIKETNNTIENIEQIKNNYKNELINDSVIMTNDLQLIRKDFSNKIKKIELNLETNINSIINNATNEIKSNIKEEHDKLNYYLNNQQNYFNNINQNISEELKQINNNYNDDIQHSTQKYSVIMNDITTLNNKIALFDKKEEINRQNFRDSITYILNSEIDKIKNDDLFNSLDLLKSIEK